MSDGVLPAAMLQKCTASDYENWSPPTPDMCLLGTNYTFTRRKGGSTCMNDIDFAVANTSTPCACTARDVECEYGYERSDNGNGQTCIPSPSFDVNTCPVRLLCLEPCFTAAQSPTLLWQWVFRWAFY